MWMESYALHVVFWVWLIPLSTRVHPHAMYQKFIPFFWFKNFFNLRLAVLGLPCGVGFPLAVVSRGHALVPLHGLLTGTAALVAEHGLWACGLQ